MAPDELEQPTASRQPARRRPKEVRQRLPDDSPGWTRTNNPPVNSRMLCQLSYRGTVLGERKL
jgi:hypothetical protein